MALVVNAYNVILVALIAGMPRVVRGRVEIVYWLPGKSTVLEVLVEGSSTTINGVPFTGSGGGGSVRGSSGGTGGGSGIVIVILCIYNYPRT